METLVWLTQSPRIGALGSCPPAGGSLPTRESSPHCVTLPFCQAACKAGAHEIERHSQSTEGNHKAESDPDMHKALCGPNSVGGRFPFRETQKSFNKVARTE